MEARVIDTSLLAAFAFGEPRSEEAISIMEGHRLFAPTLIGYELAQVAVRKIEKHPEKTHELLSSLSLALQLNITWVEVDHHEAARIALENGLTAYDASYLCVSRTLRAPLLTFDEKLRAAGTSVP